MSRPDRKKMARPSAPTGKTVQKRAPVGERGPDVVAGVRLSHPDRVLYPEQGLTKRDLASFYHRISSWILPHIVERPLSLLRCPEGQGKTCFFQKHAGTGVPEYLRPVMIQEEKARREYLYVEDERGLISLAQMGVLEIHPWGSRVGSVDAPDRLIFDLDPGPGVSWPRIVAAARAIRELLERVDLESFVKTTGGKGLHVVVPLAPRQDWTMLKDFSRAFALEVVRRSPREYTATLSKSERAGKIFVDYLRNSRGATAVAAYSTRARAGAPVSTPVSWSELGTGLRSDRFTVTNLEKRLGTIKKDPWSPFLKARQSLPKALLRKLRS